MIGRGLLATIFMMGTASWATAQDTPPPPAATMAPASPDGAPPPGGMPQPPGKGPGAKDHRGPPPPPHLTKGVDIRLGRDMGIRIECGDEPIKACLDAARSLTDKIPNLVPPPPRAGDRPEPEMPGNISPPTAN